MELFNGDAKSQQRLSEIAQVIEEYAFGNFDSEAKVTLKKDELDGIAQGINVLGQHLKNNISVLNSVLDSAPQLILTTDNEHIISRVNKGGLRVLGIGENLVLGKHIARIIEGIEECFSKEDISDSFKIKLNGPENTLFMYCSIGIIYDHQKNAIGKVFQFQDISELIQAQDELEKINEELELFNHKVAHDLRGPLASVEYVLRALEKEQKIENLSGHISSFRDLLSYLRHTVDSLLEHATAVLHMDVEPVIVDFDKLIELNKKALNAVLEYTGDQFSILFHNKLKHPFKSDENILSLVFRNLIQNAYKYRKQELNSYVEITVEELLPSNEIKIIVEDNGMGMSKERREGVFALRSPEWDVEGKKYGLLFVKKAVEKLKGFIKVEEGMHKGLRFEITIPQKG